MTTMAQHFRAEGKLEGKVEGKMGGEAIGLEKGRFIEKQTIARKLLQQGINIQIVKDVTDLSPHELEALLD
jgi:predicted transposase YdaD